MITVIQLVMLAIELGLIRRAGFVESRISEQPKSKQPKAQPSHENTDSGKPG